MSVSGSAYSYPFGKCLKEMRAESDQKIAKARKDLFNAKITQEYHDSIIAEETDFKISVAPTLCETQTFEDEKD